MKSALVLYWSEFLSSASFCLRRPSRVFCAASGPKVSSTLVNAAWTSSTSALKSPSWISAPKPSQIPANSADLSSTSTRAANASAKSADVPLIAPRNPSNAAVPFFSIWLIELEMVATVSMMPATIATPAMPAAALPTLVSDLVPSSPTLTKAVLPDCTAFLNSMALPAAKAKPPPSVAARPPVAPTAPTVSRMAGFTLLMAFAALAASPARAPNTPAAPLPTDSPRSPKLFFRIAIWPAKVCPSWRAKPPTEPARASTVAPNASVFRRLSSIWMPAFFKAVEDPPMLLPTIFAAASRSIPSLRDRSTTKGVTVLTCSSVRPIWTSSDSAPTIASPSAAVTCCRPVARSVRALPLLLNALSLFLTEFSSFSCWSSASSDAWASLNRPPTTTAPPMAVLLPIDCRRADVFAEPFSSFASRRSAAAPALSNSRTAPLASASMRICRRSRSATA